MSYPTKAGKWRALPLSVPRHRAVVRARLQCCTQPRFAAQTHDTRAGPAKGHWAVQVVETLRAELISAPEGKAWVVLSMHIPDDRKVYRTWARLFSVLSTKRTWSNRYKMIHRKFHFILFPLFFFLTGSGQTQDGAVQSGGGVSISEDTQTPTGQGPKHSALFDLAFSRGWTRSATEILSHLSYSVTIILD